MRGETFLPQAFSVLSCSWAWKSLDCIGDEVGGCLRWRLIPLSSHDHNWPRPHMLLPHSRSQSIGQTNGACAAVLTTKDKRTHILRAIAWENKARRQMASITETKRERHYEGRQDREFGDFGNLQPCCQVVKKWEPRMTFSYLGINVPIIFLCNLPAALCFDALHETSSRHFSWRDALELALYKSFDVTALLKSQAWCVYYSVQSWVKSFIRRECSKRCCLPQNFSWIRQLCHIICSSVFRKAFLWDWLSQNVRALWRVLPQNLMSDPLAMGQNLR